MSMLPRVRLEEPGASGPAGPESDDGRGTSRSRNQDQVDMSAMLAVPGLDPAKAGLPEMEGATARDVYLATINYAFPYKKMLTSFRETFKNSIGYDPENDRLLVRYLEIQRRTNGGEWENVTDQIREQEKDFLLSAPNPFDDKYANRALTRPFPPVLLSDYYRLARHSMIPLVELPVDEPATGGAGQGRLAGGGTGTARQGTRGGTGGSRGMSGPPGGAGRSGPPPGASRSSSQGMSGSQGMTGSRGMTGSGAAGARGTGPQTAEVDFKDAAEHQMVRFTDQNIQPGNTYEYRVRVWVYDPNNPVKMDGYVAKQEVLGPTRMMATATDSDRAGDMHRDEAELESMVIQSNVKVDHLSSEVRERLSLESRLERPLPMLRNCRPSPWSDPTGPIQVGPIKGQAFVANADVPREGRVQGQDREIRFPIREASLKAVAAIWDSQLGVQVPLVLDAVYPGSVLGGTGVARVLDPIQRIYRKLENNDGTPVTSGRAPGYRGSSGVLLVDFLGGREIDGGTQSRSPFRVPTEALLLDSTGQLLVRNSVADAGDFTWLSGEVLREDGVARRQEEMGDDTADRGRSRQGQQGQQRGRSSYPGSGGSGGMSGPPGPGGPGRQ